jgi:hypothetical protein
VLADGTVEVNKRFALADDGHHEKGVVESAWVDGRLTDDGAPWGGGQKGPPPLPITQRAT